MSDKDEVYQALTNHLDQVNRHIIHLILCDFNARVGGNSPILQAIVIGLHCLYDTTNNNRERLVCQDYKYNQDK